MFYTQVVQRHSNKPVSSNKRKTRDFQATDSEMISQKKSHSAQVKTKEYIRNAQRVYFYERRMFS